MFQMDRQLIPDVLDVPPELENALKKNRKALKNWDSFPPGRRKQIIYWILDSKLPETKIRRIAKAVKLAEKKQEISHIGHECS